MAVHDTSARKHFFETGDTHYSGFVAKARSLRAQLAHVFASADYKFDALDAKGRQRKDLGPELDAAELTDLYERACLDYVYDRPSTVDAARWYLDLALEIMGRQLAGLDTIVCTDPYFALALVRAVRATLFDLEGEPD